MSNRLVIANNDKLKFMCLFDEYDSLLEIQPFMEGLESKIGNIYLGVIQTKIKGIGGFFVNYGGPKNGFLPINIHTNNLSPGQRVLVQVEKDPFSSKGAKLTTNLSFSGEFLVLTTDSSDIHFSGKLPVDARTKGIRSIISKIKPEDCGIIVRTNCYNAANDAIVNELNALLASYVKVQEAKEFRTDYSAVYEKDQGWIKYVQNLNRSQLAEILVDNEADKKVIDEKLSISLHNNITVNLVEDLFGKFDLFTLINKLSLRKIWLSSGGSIVIDPTEALTIIDVNSGKNVKKINRHRNQLKINKEAALASLKEIRRRNLSGIILIDFIDLEHEEDRLALTEYMEGLAAFDSIKVTVHGLTKLNIMEITRVRKEQKVVEKLKSFGYYQNKQSFS